MKRILIALSLAAVLALTGCEKAAISTQQTNNPAIRAEFLFENEGVRVYRFYDNGRAIYYTNAAGATQWSITRQDANNQQHTEYYSVSTENATKHPVSLMKDNAP